MPIEVDKKTYLEPEYADFLRKQQLVSKRARPSCLPMAAMVVGRLLLLFNPQWPLLAGPQCRLLAGGFTVIKGAHWFLWVELT